MPMLRDVQVARARQLTALHASPQLLLLPNPWDAVSARLLAGLTAVAALGTTSAGIAAAHGYSDGQHIGRKQMLAAITQIVAAVDIPVSADLEAGYGDTPEEVADTVAGALAAGAVGINLEDGDPHRPDELVDVELHAEKIRAARQVAVESGVPLVVNARTDTYWRGVGAPGERLTESLRRLQRYREAGANCVFLPGFPDLGSRGREVTDVIRGVVEAVDPTPLNLLAAPHLPSPGRLAELGVRRLSVGSALYRLALAAARTALEAALAGNTRPLGDGAAALPYNHLAQLLRPAP
jgi:2-methylisocitrate lyase-like PEP mutase family enzyme